MDGARPHAEDGFQAYNPGLFLAKVSPYVSLVASDKLLMQLSQPCKM